jgi:hypothetical protein
MPFYLQNAANQGVHPNFSSFRCFHLCFTIEFIKEFEGAPIDQRTLMMKEINLLKGSVFNMALNI